MNKMQMRLSQLGISLESPVESSMVLATPEPPTIEESQPPVDEVEYQDAVGSLESATDAHGRLSRLAVTLESMAQSNGMSDTEAALFNHAVDGICAGTPISHDVPSLESAAHAVGRLRNANVALEDVGDRLESAVKWIKTVLGELIKAIIKGIVRTISTLNSLGHRIDQIEWPKLWDSAEYLWMPAEVFKTFGVAPKDASFETIEKIMQHHAKYSSFFETRLVPALVNLTKTAIDDYKSTPAQPGVSNNSSERYDEMIHRARTSFNDVVKGFFGRMSQGDVPDEEDFYHQIRNGLVLPGGFRWTLNYYDRPEFEDVIAAHYSDRILWTGKPESIKIKVPEQRDAEDLLKLAKQANDSISKGITALDKVIQELDEISNNVTGTSVGGNDNAIQFRHFVVEFLQAYRGITSVHGRYAQKVTSGLIRFFKAKADEGQEHA